MSDSGEKEYFAGEDEEIVKVELAPGLDVLAWVGILVAFIILGLGIWFLIANFG